MIETDWQEFTHPTIQVRFRYPAATPQGHAVDIEERQGAESSRVHLLSRPAQEVYFEVGRYGELSAQEEYQRHTSYLQARFEGEAFSVSELQESSLGGSQALRYVLTWSDRERVVTLVQRQRDVYRVIYDPRAPLNVQILETLEFLE